MPGRNSDAWPPKMEDSALESNLAMALAYRRKAIGMSGAECARHMHITRPCLYHWEQGLAYADRFSKWQRLARTLGLTFHVELRKGGVPWTSDSSAPR